MNSFSQRLEEDGGRRYRLKATHNWPIDYSLTASINNAITVN